MLEFVLDWHLIYRDTKKSGLLVPDQITPDMLKIKRDSTSVNVFIEIRKPNHAL
jgi:extracellular factor (EF) 3-hydroxypalmitic acid methyl ester biosynthesis protein